MRKLCAWTEEYSTDESNSILRDFALHHAKQGGAEGERIAGCIASGDYLTLCNWSLRYSPTDSPIELYHCRQSLAFFQKSRNLDLGIDREAVAYRKFQEAEALCRETNAIFALKRQGGFYFPLDVESVFHRASYKIAKMLGDVPQLSELRLRFGPGATTRTKKRDASIREKLQAGVSCSEELFPRCASVLGELPHLTDLLDSRQGTSDEWATVPVEVTTGKLSFVPKNAKTFRAVVTEPVLNGIVQLGIGDYVSDRLRAFGLNLRDQSHNQRLAREGSLTGALATLDLSSASDTISRELVYDLLPLDWAHFLNAFRSRKVSYGNTVINQEKFSSMGNGYTFPLESLIFYALTSACCSDGETVSVYGDDIICPSHRVPLVTKVLTAAGFIINTDKSYWSGPFRESCGADYFRGFDIRPCYHKNNVSAASLFVLHNYYVRTFQTVEAEMVRNWIHPSLQLFGPDGFGDGHLLGKWTPRPHKREFGYEGYLFDTFTLNPRRDSRRLQPGDRILPLYSVYIGGQTPIIDLVKITLSRFLRRDRSTHVSPGDVREASLPFAKSRDGSPVCSLPGAKGYKRVSIYTLTADLF